MLRKRMVLIAAGLALVFAWSGERANAQGVFTITSPSFKDGPIRPPAPRATRC